MAKTRTSGSDVDITLRVRQANLPALLAGVALGTDAQTGRPITIRLVQQGKVFGLEVEAGPGALAATPEPVDVQRMDGPEGGAS